MFSVVIPLYNKGPLVKRAIDSVLSQSCQDFEIVVVDDGSKDDSAEYVKEYANERIKYYYKENGGVSSARNYGIEKATNDWIVFLDADDELLPNALEIYSLLSKSYPSSRFLASRQDSHYSDCGFISNYYNRDLKSFHCSKSTYFDLWLRLFYSSPGTMCVHKSLFFEKGVFDGRMKFFEDFELLLRLLNNENVAYSSARTMKYYQESTGLSGSSHSIEKEMAYYIPEYVETSSFWHKALLYENLEAEIYWWQLKGVEENAKFYQDMQKKYFGSVYKILHWIRQKMIRMGFV